MPVADNTSRILNHQQGYTLVELVIGIVVFGVALVLLSTTLFPMFAKSANPHYEARAAALGQAVMNQILARQFDKHSDPNGSRWRCDENAEAVIAQGIIAPTPIPSCSSPLFAGMGFFAVEDYIGCWGERTACTQDHRGPLTALTGGSADDYRGFTVNIHVEYDSHTFPDSTHNDRLYKRIDLYVDTGRFGRVDFTAYRSNF